MRRRKGGHCPQTKQPVSLTRPLVPPVPSVAAAVLPRGTAVPKSGLSAEREARIVADRLVPAARLREDDPRRTRRLDGRTHMSWTYVRQVLAGALALIAAATLSVHAQDYPTKPVTIVVPLAAGSGMDSLVRLYA